MLRSLLPKAHQKFLSLPLLGPITDGFDDWLAASGYTPGSREFAIRMLAHVDAYRLGSPREAEDLLLEEFLVSPWCLAVEWPDRLPGWIPPDAWHLGFEIEADGRHSIRLGRP